LYATVGDYDAALAHYEAACELEARVGFDALELRTMLWTCRALAARARPGDDDRARALATQAHARAAALGMTALVESFAAVVV
jgi:hypothetical protein